MKLHFIHSWWRAGNAILDGRSFMVKMCLKCNKIKYIPD